MAVWSVSKIQCWRNFVLKSVVVKYICSLPGKTVLIPCKMGLNWGHVYFDWQIWPRCGSRGVVYCWILGFNRCCHCCNTLRIIPNFIKNRCCYCCYKIWHKIPSELGFNRCFHCCNTLRIVPNFIKNRHCHYCYKIQPQTPSELGFYGNSYFLYHNLHVCRHRLCYCVF